MNKLNEIIFELVDLANEVEVETTSQADTKVELKREQSQINWFLNQSGEHEEDFFNIDLFDDIRLLESDTIIGI